MALDAVISGLRAGNFQLNAGGAASIVLGSCKSMLSREGFPPASMDRLGVYNQALARAMRAASTLLEAASLAIASER
jgi:hypothetical protein